MRGSHAVAAVEYAYHLVRRRHPELPHERDVLCLVELPAVRHGGWMQEPHQTSDQYTLVLTTQTLHHHRHALYIVLHECAHILAHVREVRDMRADRKYHTTVFRDLAREFGLVAKRSALRAQDGYAFTEPLPSANLDVVYADAITRFDQLKGTRL